MAKPLEATNRILTVLNNAPASTLDSIVSLAGDEFNKQRIATVLNAQWRQGHVEKKRRDDGEFGFSLTEPGQRAFDLLASASEALQKNRRTKTLNEAIGEVKAQLIAGRPDHVQFPREKLRLLAAAALASTKPLAADLRDACLLAIKEAA